MTIKLNKNNPKTNEIIQAIKKNDGYCPCKLIKNEDTKCMCKEFQEQEKGICHCGLFVKEA
jgi:ferredoxin-thioredoxin reductase catalytic subunit